ncbi:hypothetical protein QBC41DRAFT_302048 [Cercophora samala]|uniref:Uncharacterized protein n=1 Tax=Cercophora samala TaxID=330535 RepID=A0AA40DCC8_9PEZI|nr:hypothetical protein QBC41DRAFT_302048 [Cercophora samala]
MSRSVFNWPAIEESIEMNDIVFGKDDKKVFMPVARDVIQDMRHNKGMTMSVLRHDCREILKQVNKQYQSAASSVIDSVSRSVVKGSEVNKLILKRHFFAFTLGWIELSMAKQGISESSESLSANWDLVALDPDWDTFGDDEDWTLVEKADLV